MLLAGGRRRAVQRDVRIRGVARFPGWMPGIPRGAGISSIAATPFPHMVCPQTNNRAEVKLFNFGRCVCVLHGAVEQTNQMPLLGWREAWHRLLSNLILERRRADVYTDGGEKKEDRMTSYNPGASIILTVVT